MAHGRRASPPAWLPGGHDSLELGDLEATVAVQAAIIAELRAVNAAQARAIATLEARVAS